MLEQIIVDGNSLTAEKLQELMNNPKVRIIKISEGVYKTLKLIKG